VAARGQQPEKSHQTMSQRLLRSCFLVGLIAALTPACKPDAHTAAGASDGDEDKLPGQSVTIWTPHHELFMEYAPLVVGQESAFGAHVTMIPGFKAATAGVVTVTITQGGDVLTARADAPTNPGIFRPTVTPKKAGECKMTVTIEREGAPRDLLDIEGCRVFADVAAAKTALGEEEETPGRITYLKEQAWKTDFAVLAVGKQELQPTVRAPGEIRAAAGKDARLTAPVAGRVTLADPNLIPGARVKQGQLLATVAARLEGGADRPTLEAEVQTARAELAAAEAQVTRAERLVADRAIPEKQLEQARTTVTLARARLGAATGRMQQFTTGAAGGGGGTGYQVKAPLDGVIAELAVTSGQAVQEGAPLVTVTELSRVWLEVRVYETDLPKVEGAVDAWFQVAGTEEPVAVSAQHGRLVTIGHVVHEKTRTVPVTFELENTTGRLRIGQSARVWLATGAAISALAIPESAILDDAGKSVAYVQVEGEAFERRVLTLGVRTRGWIEVKDGLAAGEHVVTVGAYDIKLASSAGSVPAHGHAH
jgi:membrane fusion protein, heavy metal efflux system